MDAFETALEVLELGDDGSPKDWLKIELLILNKKYIEALQFSFDLEKKYVSNPETIFDTLYYRSLAFYQLNEKEKAKNILLKILEIKPEHIKSKIKLGEWKDLG
jgi:tetratricopeptide (TPR) repeat protein